MGYSYSNQRERRAHEASLKERGLDEASKQKALAKVIAAGRNEMAMKIVMAVVDRVVNEIIRPGPKPEERECYVMAGESGRSRQSWKRWCGRSSTLTMGCADMATLKTAERTGA